MNTNNFLKHIKKNLRGSFLSIQSILDIIADLSLSNTSTTSKSFKNISATFFSFERVIAKIVFQTQHRFTLRIYNRQVKIEHSFCL